MHVGAHARGSGLAKQPGFLNQGLDLGSARSNPQ
jgi:hypothetical protein